VTRFVRGLALLLAFFGVSCTSDDEYSAKYLPILRRYADYADEDVAGLPVAFTDQGSSDEDLAALRASYGLEQIAGFAAYPDGRERLSWVGITHVRVRPTWLRYSDFATRPARVATLTVADLG